MRFRWASISFAEPGRSIATARTTARSRRYRAGRSRMMTHRRCHCDHGVLFGEHVTRWWWRRERSWRRQRMLFHLQSAYDNSLAIVIPFRQLVVVFRYFYIRECYLQRLAAWVSVIKIYIIVFDMWMCVCVLKCEWKQRQQQQKSCIYLHIKEMGKQLKQNDLLFSIWQLDKNTHRLFAVCNINCWYVVYRWMKETWVRVTAHLLFQQETNMRITGCRKHCVDFRNSRICVRRGGERCLLKITAARCFFELLNDSRYAWTSHTSDWRHFLWNRFGGHTWIQEYYPGSGRCKRGRYIYIYISTWTTLTICCIRLANKGLADTLWNDVAAFGPWNAWNAGGWFVGNTWYGEPCRG